MTQSHRQTLNEVILENTFDEIERGTELLDVRIMEVAKQAAELAHKLIELKSC